MTKINNSIPKTEVNTFYYYANKYRQLITAEEELEKIDMTDVFLKELEKMIKEGELINININGKVRVGKSTMAFAISKIIFKLLQKYEYVEKKEKFGVKNIARDQQEYNKMMRDPKTRFTIIAVDEDNKAERTGENSSVERAVEETMSDVHAARYVHKTQCSPKDTTDDNCDILLSVIGVNKHERTTHSKLYYRFYEGGSQYIQLLGYVRIDVNNIIKTWEDRVKKHYYKPRQTEEDIMIINTMKKKDWYTHYVIKKHEKMDIMTKEGINKPRTLDYAEIIIKTIEQLKKLAILTRTIDHNIVRNMIKSKAREYRIPLSIVGEELSTREVMGTLKLYETIHNINVRINKMKIKDYTSPAEYNKQRGRLEEIKEEVQNCINRQEEEYKKYAEIKERYDKR